jgi:hypothetical protein
MDKEDPGNNGMIVDGTENEVSWETVAGMTGRG